MMTSFVKKSVVALVAAVGLSAPSYAQLDGLTGALGGGLGGGSVPMVGDLLGVGGIPVVGDVLNGVVPVLGSLVGGDVLGDILGGSLVGLGELPVVLGNLSDVGLSVLGPYLESPLKVVNVLEGLGGVGISSLLQPQSIISPVSGLVSANGFAVVPILEVLVSDPASLFNYLSNEGGILTGSIAVIPAIPLLNSPI
ncbi:hypothetical protein [Zhongshania marina]|uniref:Uncharacterized protein n=1 Tax=Zhongshania marina TaxID=2304603 RepID=A0ABX9W5T0_9GAMM|nr:hypothetical protein D0911_04455 [Zhongshania marina]